MPLATRRLLVLLSSIMGVGLIAPTALRVM
jgi:hypothetical protein